MITQEEAKFVLEVADDYENGNFWGHIDRDGVAHL